MRDAEARANTAVERRCRSGKQAAEKLEISAFFTLATATVEEIYCILLKMCFELRLAFK